MVLSFFTFSLPSQADNSNIIKILINPLLNPLLPIFLDLYCMFFSSPRYREISSRGSLAAVKLILINYLMLNLFGFYHGNLGEQLATFQYTKIIKPKVFLKRLLSLSINIPIPLFLYSKYEL